MKAPKSMTGIFKDLNRNLQKTNASQKTFVVVRVKKDGTPSKVQPGDYRFCAAITMEGAENIKAGLEQMNPGQSFVIVEQ